MNTKDKIIFAADYDDTPFEILNKIAPYIGMVKVGLQLFISNPQAASEIKEKYNLPIFLDLKLHDIPNTVHEAVLAVERMKCVNWLSIHCNQNIETIRAAIDAADKLTLVGITHLTSDFVKDKIGLENDLLQFTGLNDFNNLGHFVCSVNDAVFIKQNTSNVKLITPGIRLPNQDKNDQQRTGTPREAIQNGADYIVVGRAVSRARDPLEAIMAIHANIES